MRLRVIAVVIAIPIVSCSAERKPAAQAMVRGCEVVFVDGYNPIHKYIARDVAFMCPLRPEQDVERARYGAPVEVCVDRNGQLGLVGDTGETCVLKMKARYIGWGRLEERDVSYVTPEFSPAKLPRADWWDLEGKGERRRVADLLAGEFPTNPHIAVVRVMSVAEKEGYPVRPK